ncbi:MAG: heme exporter protein CcmD [Thauera sp.]|jgi:heme exporter protein D|uniref:heme exporter protein CcmD n=1 Tax=Methyloversatilis sp. MC4-4 TaxID=3132824 RepID=UPI000DB346AB|nr:heme exporter protein CcmD [Methyloversatilis sp.]PZU51568.1 MAG: heme exporter protein CcmD [Thauera sp.]
MNWESASHFWAMGGYGFFVWGSYGVTAAVIAAELFALSRRMKNARAQARRDVALERIDADKRGRA